jgi:hypothetical protein
MEGMRAFAVRHLSGLSNVLTHVLCVDTVGSPHLVLAEGEGMLRMHRYDHDFNELISACAEATQVAVRRGLRIRLGTDGLVALRRGFPAAMLMSIDKHGAPSNYHRPTDTPDRVDYARLEDTVRLCDRVVRALAGEPPGAKARVSPAAPAARPARERSAAAP